MRDLDAGLLELCAFRRFRHQDWVGVVYVRVNFPAGGRLTQQIKAALADGQMLHRTRAASTGPYGCKFSVTPECAVENKDIGTVNGIDQFVSHDSNARRNQRDCSRQIVATLESGAMRQLYSAKSDAAVQRLKIRADLSPFYSAELGEYGIKPSKRSSGFIRCIDRYLLVLLPQEQETEHMIHVGICQKNAGDRSVAWRMVARMQRRHGFDLPAEIRRRVD